VSLAVGLLLHEGKIGSLDAPLSTWYPEWSVGLRSEITLCHVLSHTSGLENRAVDLEMYAQRDTVAFARTLSRTHPPGQYYVYNNEAIQLLSGIVRRAAGVELDAYLAKRVFLPLGIRNAPWEKDSAGHCLAYAGLALTPRDLAKVGQLMAQRGNWEGRQLAPRAWFSRAARPAVAAPSYGLLFELWFDEYSHVSTPETLRAMRLAGLPFADKLRPLIGRPFRYRAAYWLEAGALLSATDRLKLVTALEDRRTWLPFRSRPGRLSGFGHSGTFGQYLMVYPDYRLVVVRLVREFDASRPRVDFEERVMVLLRRSGLATGVDAFTPNRDD
jgi:CubicO group peptidase (beta-lactamase class C family)